VEETEQTEIDLAEGSATNLAAKTELVGNPRFHSMSGELNPRDSKFRMEGVGSSSKEMETKRSRI